MTSTHSPDAIDAAGRRVADAGRGVANTERGIANVGRRVTNAGRRTGNDDSDRPHIVPYDLAPELYDP